MPIFSHNEPSALRVRHREERGFIVSGREPVSWPRTSSSGHIIDFIEADITRHPIIFGHCFRAIHRGEYRRIYDMDYDHSRKSPKVCRRHGGPLPRYTRLAVLFEPFN